MNNSKPIFIVKLPYHAQNNDIDRIREMMDDALGGEYHVITMVKGNTSDEDTSFECYNSPYSDEEFNDLKELTLKLINENSLQ